MTPGLREFLLRVALFATIMAAVLALVVFFAFVVLRSPACTDPADPLYRLECRL